MLGRPYSSLLLRLQIPSLVLRSSNLLADKGLLKMSIICSLCVLFDVEIFSFCVRNWYCSLIINKKLSVFFLLRKKITQYLPQPQSSIYSGSRRTNSASALDWAIVSFSFFWTPWKIPDPKLKQYHDVLFISSLSLRGKNTESPSNFIYPKGKGKPWENPKQMDKMVSQSNSGIKVGYARGKC